MSLRRILATVAVALGSSVLSAHAVSPSAAHAASSWTEVSTTVDVPCYVFTYHQAADWYFPATSSPKGLVYLQHGFSRSNGNMRDPAEHYAAAGFPVFAPTLPSADLYGCTVSNMGNNNPFLNDVAAWLGTATGSTGNLAKSYATAATKAGRSGQALPSKCVIAGHSAGSESATYVANRLRTTYPAAFAKLRFVQLLDPVTSAFGNNEPAALAGLATTSLPILAISSPPHLGNGNASGTVALTDALDRAFLGVRLVTGCHCDAEGASTDALCTLLAGTPQARNITALQTLAVAWATDAADGTTTATDYPGGAYYQSLLTAGVIETLS